MEIKIVGEQAKTDVEKIEERNNASLPQEVLEGGNEGEIDHIAVKQVLDLDRDNNDYDSEIGTLVEWAKSQTDSDDYQDLKWAIRDLRMRLGTPTHGDSIKHLARFAYLDLEDKRIKAEKRNMI